MLTLVILLSWLSKYMNAVKTPLTCDWNAPVADDHNLVLWPFMGSMATRDRHGQVIKMESSGSKTAYRTISTARGVEIRE
jgi:hypothetical protein